MGKKLEPRPLPTGWKAFKLPCANVLAYQNTEHRLVEFSYELVCNPEYAYPEKREKRGNLTGYQVFLDDRKGNGRRMAELAAEWRVLSDAEKKTYNEQAQAKRNKLKADAAGAGEPADAPSSKRPKAVASKDESDCSASSSRSDA
jgi:hypothetical protein